MGAGYKTLGRGRLEAVAVLGIHVVITLALFRDLLPALGAHLFGDLGDPLLNTAILAWNARVAPLTSAWWNFPSFAPLSGVTAWTEHLLGVYPLTSPIVWMTGNAVLAYNVLQLLSPPLNGLCTFLLVREVTGSAVGGFVGGLAFAFAPFHGEHATHIQLVTAYGMPLALYGLHAYLRTRSRAALAWFGIGWLSALLSSAYLLVFFPMLVLLWCVWFLRSQAWRAWAAIAVTALVAALPIVPLLWGYYVRQRAYAFARSYDELQAFSASLVALAGIPHRSVLWRGVLPGTFYEASLFPGMAIAILVVIALLARVGPSERAAEEAHVRRACVLFYVVAAVVMWSLAIGPEPTWSGGSAPVYGPYWLLLHAPGAQSIRVPARAWLVSTMCLAVCAGAGAADLAGRRRLRWVVLPLALVIVAEGWFVDRTFAVPAPDRDARIPAHATVLDLPLYPGYENAVPQYFAVLSGYRAINGYSGYEAPHVGPLRDALGQHRSAALNVFRRRGDLYVLVRPPVDRPLVEWLESQPAVAPMEPAGEVRLYRLPRIGPGPAVAELTPLPRPGRAQFSVP